MKIGDIIKFKNSRVYGLIYKIDPDYISDLDSWVSVYCGTLKQVKQLKYSNKSLDLKKESTFFRNMILLQNEIDIPEECYWKQCASISEIFRNRYCDNGCENCKYLKYKNYV